MEVELYVKIHNKTGLKYFGKHKVCSVPTHEYPGSGKLWTEHLEEYGDDVTTHIVGRWDEDDPELEYAALSLSEYWNIVESDEWANLIPENGKDGGWEQVNASGKNIYYLENGEIGNKINLLKQQEKSQKKLKWLMENNPEWAKNFSEKMSKAIKKKYENGYVNPFTGKKHTDETKK